MGSLTTVKGTRSRPKELCSIMLSESLAELIFGSQDPINKLVAIDNKKEVKVTGVYQDLPRNSEFHDLAFIAPWDLYVAQNDWLVRLADSWDHSMVHLFVQLSLLADEEAVSSRIGPTIYDRENERYKVFKRQIFLHPMSKWHLHEQFDNGVNTGGRIQFVLLFGIISVFILLLAVINCMNLSSAIAEYRAQDVRI